MRSDKFPAEIATQITKCNKNLLYPKKGKADFGEITENIYLTVRDQVIDDIKKGEEEIGDESGGSKGKSRSAGCQNDAGGKSQSVKVRCTCNKKIGNSGI